MSEFCRSAEKRMQTLAGEAADQFDTTLLHNRVHEQVSGQWNRENDLMRVLDLAERAYDLSAERRMVDDGSGMAIFGAAEDLNDQVGRLVDEQVAIACAAVVAEGDDWTDAWDEEAIVEAQTEANGWLCAHLDAAERADVREEVVADV